MAISTTSSSSIEKPKIEEEEDVTIIDIEDSGKRRKVEIDPNTDEIEFHFNEGSHPGSRSYVTHITDDSISLEIYGIADILHEEDFPFNKLRFQKLVELIKNLDIHEIPKFDNDSQGGETLTLKLFKDGEEYYSGYIYGSKYKHDAGTTDANLYLVKSEIEKCIPNFQALLTKEKEEEPEEYEEEPSFFEKYWKYGLAAVVVLLCIYFCYYWNIASEKDSINALYANIESVNSKEIDLGLPSGTIWAGWNVGANAANDYGALYTWGAVTPSNEESYSEYYNSLSTLYIDSVCYAKNGMISGSIYDVALNDWGENWRIPTKQQVDELIFQCEWKRGSYKGCEGMIGKGPNGNLIFFPATGYGNENGTWHKNEEGDYWCGDLCNPSMHNHSNYAPGVEEDARDGRRANSYSFSKTNDIHTGCGPRNLGCAVRPVKE